MFNRKPDKESQFSSCLKALHDGETMAAVLQRQPGITRGLRAQLEAASWLIDRRPVVSTRLSFIPDSRRRLTERIRAEARRRPTPSEARIGRLVHWPWSLRQAVQALVLVIFLFSLVSVSRDAVVSAQIALPGDALYPLKLFSEGAQLALTFSPYERSRLQVGYCRERANEIEELILEGRYDRLSRAAVNYILQVEQTQQALDSLSLRHPLQAASMESQLHKTFTSQAIALPVLINMLPMEARSSVQSVMLVAH